MSDNLKTSSEEMPNNDSMPAHKREMAVLASFVYLQSFAASNANRNRSDEAATLLKPSKCRRIHSASSAENSCLEAAGQV